MLFLRPNMDPALHFLFCPLWWDFQLEKKYYQRFNQIVSLCLCPIIWFVWISSNLNWFDSTIQIHSWYPVPDSREFRSGLNDYGTCLIRCLIEHACVNLVMWIFLWLPVIIINNTAMSFFFNGPRWPIPMYTHTPMACQAFFAAVNLFRPSGTKQQKNQMIWIDFHLTNWI